MDKIRISGWLGFYALFPLMVALVVINAGANMPQSSHRILLVVSVVAVCRLALSWVDKHPRLVERSGVGLAYAGQKTTEPSCTRRCYPTFEDLYQPEPIRHDDRIKGQE